MEGPWDELLYFFILSATMMILGPVIHEFFHLVVADALGCPYAIKFGIMAGETQLDCFEGYGATFLFLMAGIGLSFILSQLLFIIAWECGNELISLSIESFSAGIIFCNAFSLFSSYNDITIMGQIVRMNVFPVSIATGIVLSIVGITELGILVLDRYRPE